MRLSFLKKINTAEANLSESKGEDRYLVYRRHAGIGDLLIGLYYSWKYASATKRKLIVDWRWSTYTNTSSNLFSYLFQDCFIKGVPLIGTNVDKIQYPPPFYPAFYNNTNIHTPPDIYSNQIYKSHAEKRIFANKICSFFPFEERTIVMNEGVTISPYQDPLDDKSKNFINILWSTMVESMTVHMKKTHSELFPDNENIIGIHIRLGNNGEPFGVNNGIERVKGYHWQDIGDYLRQEIIPIIKKLPKDYHIYVAADTEEANDQAKKLIPGCITYEKWFAPPGCEIHFASSEVSGSNGIEILRDALTEVFLLSQCDSVYSTLEHSAFAKLAGAIGEHPPIFFI